MHHAIDFIQDLAVIMLLAGIVTVIFNRFRQPVVLGYIVAGVIIGPYTPPFALIHDEKTIGILAELGVVFLMFSLGLEFSLRKLARVGVTAFVAAITEIVLMLWIGYEIGRFFGWKSMDSIFLGAMLAVSSTTIIVKALDELGMKRERFAQLIFGVLIVEDVLAIGMIALLSGIAISGSVDAGEATFTLGKLLLFMVVSLVVGILLVPRILAYVAKFKSDEMLLVVVLGLCFGFCLLVIQMGYSVALGAFLIGAIMAEARELHTIERLVAPLRDMFSAVFFVTIGLLLDPHVLATYVWPILVITVAVVIGKIVSCGLGAYLSGQDGSTSMRVGMGLSQIGEFSFIIASLGLSLKVTSDFLYPIAVAVSVITTLLTPYLIKSADPFTRWLGRAMPGRLSYVLGQYTQWLQSIQLTGDSAALVTIIRRIVVSVAINLALVVTIFLGGAFFYGRLADLMSPWVSDPSLQSALVWGGALVVSLPFLIAVYRKVKSLSLLLVELSVPPSLTGRYTFQVRRVVAEILPIAAMVGVILLVAALSASILPSTEMVALIVAGTVILAIAMRSWFVRMHAKLQIALKETLEHQPDGDHGGGSPH
ncbi:cation:proton antiporter [Pandoraea nosoerga]|uniref:Potassium transporter n=1 Tax=Pandoraea nosoerga TaxID=2508296 RepID=A0A5E4TZY3_9BURK|nr:MULTISPECIES: cation:proton antiporter [Pandoraea]MBN4666648.1 cation:proton antiporter [Pandoraea nosoerga]MBN4676767.1 cation:proton antiporter [Pandoraea nosoerga]MBN4682772.1 cation:proton antiporter [Pandoraea nosoerga]MBN4745823.1 cation:proton antiporter [Pandoraea nosoerga]VVD93407.1 potassium transporter [Pandoraea nosoerga]